MMMMLSARSTAGRGFARCLSKHKAAFFSTAAVSDGHDSPITNTNVNQLLFQPTEEHAALRDMLRSFVRDQVEPQANDFNEREAFHVDLFRQLADLGVMGLTVPEECTYGVMMILTEQNKKQQKQKTKSSSLFR